MLGTPDVDEVLQVGFHENRVQAAALSALDAASDTASFVTANTLPGHSFILLLIIFNILFVCSCKTKSS